MYTVKNNLSTAVNIPPFLKLAPGESVDLPDAYDVGFLAPYVKSGTITVTEIPAESRGYNWTAAQRVAVGAASVQSAVINATEIMLIATVNCFIKLDETSANNPVAANAAGNMPILANDKFHLQIPSGKKLAVIRETVDGFLHIFPVR
jgi:hypothetical protein